MAELVVIPDKSRNCVRYFVIFLPLQRPGHSLLGLIIFINQSIEDHVVIKSFIYK